MFRPLSRCASFVLVCVFATAIQTQSRAAEKLQANDGRIKCQVAAPDGGWLGSSARLSARMFGTKYGPEACTGTRSATVGPQEA